jgi:hypothetical protein
VVQQRAPDQTAESAIAAALSLPPSASLGVKLLSRLMHSQRVDGAPLRSLKLTPFLKPPSIPLLRLGGDALLGVSMRPRRRLQ